MKVQKIPSAPQPRRENNRSSGGNGSRMSDGGPRQVGSAGGNDSSASGAKGPGRGPSKSGESGDDSVSKKPRRTFDGGRCTSSSFVISLKASSLK